MKTIKTIIAVIICAVFFPFVFVWALCRAAKDADEYQSAFDREHAMNRAEYFKRNLQ